MTDKILKEAFDKLTAIEESEDPFCIGEAADDFDPDELEDYEAPTGDAPADDNLHDKAIDMLDDMLDQLEGDDRYGEKGDVLRYAIKRLQEVGLGR